MADPVIVCGVVQPDYSDCCDGPVTSVVVIPPEEPPPSTSDCPHYCGTLSPEGVVTADVGRIYDQTDAVSTTHPGWRKRTGVGNTGWHAWDGLRGNPGADTTFRIGDGADVGTSVNSIAFGEGASAGGDNSIAVGLSPSASQSDAIGIGSNVLATGASAVAIGKSAQASGLRSEAIGQDSIASATDAKAFGSGATASGVSSVSIGVGAVASATETVALGKAALASGLNSIAVGSTTAANKLEISIGTRNVGIGGTHYSPQVDGPIMIGNDIDLSDAVFFNDGSIAIGSHVTFGPDASNGIVAIGRNVHVTGTESVVIGDDAMLGESTASLDFGDDAVIIGARATGYESCLVAIGHDSLCRAFGTVAIGSHAIAGDATGGGGLSVAVGRFAKTEGGNSVALGSQAYAQYSASIALGYAAIAPAANKMMIGSASAPIDEIQVRTSTGVKIITMV